MTLFYPKLQECLSPNFDWTSAPFVVHWGRWAAQLHERGPLLWKSMGDAMCWRTSSKDEKVSREQRRRRLTGRPGMESPAWHEPTAL